MEIYLSEEDKNIADNILCLSIRELLLDRNPLDKAFEVLCDLCFEAPERAANIVLFIGLHCKDDWILGILTAGPLELILDNHGEKVIDRFMDMAKSNQIIKDMLCEANLSLAPASIQKKVDDICGAGENSAT